MRHLRVPGLLAGLALALAAVGCAHGLRPGPTGALPLREADVRVPTSDGRVPFLAGTLYLQGGGPRPGVVLVQGSGPTDRSWNTRLIPGVVGTGAQLARHLSQAGFVVLSFDKRGAGQTPEDPAQTDTTQLDDVLAAHDFLATHGAVQPCGVVLVGHSEGAALARRAAGQRPSVLALVMLAGAGRTTRALLRAQLRDNVLGPAGLSGEAAETNLRYVEEALVAASAGRPAPPPGPEVHAKVLELLSLLTSSPRLRGLVAQFDSDPAAELRSLRLPIAIVGGGRDVQIGRADFDALRAAAPAARATWIEEMDHVLKVERRGLGALGGDAGAARYAEDRPVHPDLLREVARFLRSTASPDVACQPR